MPSERIIQTASDKMFCQRVAFIAFQVAEEVTGELPETPNHMERVAYADMIYRGDEKALLLTLHVVASSTEICMALESGTQSDVLDEDILLAVRAVWQPRAMAAAAIRSELQWAKEVSYKAGQLMENVNNMALRIEGYRMEKEVVPAPTPVSK